MYILDLDEYIPPSALLFLSNRFTEGNLPRWYQTIDLYRYISLLDESKGPRVEIYGFDVSNLYTGYMATFTSKDNKKCPSNAMGYMQKGKKPRIMQYGAEWMEVA